MSEPAVSDIYVVIAAFNEGPIIGEVVTQLCARYPSAIVVDDGSTDDTGERARAAGATVLRHAINRGQGAALQSGITYALQRGAHIIVTFDADGQHAATDIPALIEPIASGEVDVTLGSRFLGDTSSVPFGRRLLLAGGVLFTWAASGTRLTDAHNGLRAFSRRAAEQIDIQMDRMAHASELIDQIRRARLSYTEVSVNIHYTEYSLAKGQRASSAIRVAFDYLFARFLS